MKTKIIIYTLIVFAFIGNVQSQELKEAFNTILKTGAYIYADGKTDNTLSRLTGSWKKSYILYPNGRKEWIPSNEQFVFNFFPDLNSNTALMGYQTFVPGRNTAYEEGILWFGQGGTLCLGPVYNRNTTGLTYKFGTDDRGMECLMIKALIFSSEDVWIIYRRI